jgi:NitT/TauT family transport system permease protein
MSTPAPDPAEVLEDRGTPAQAHSFAWAVRLAAICVTLIGWELIGRQINPLFMSYPTAIAQAGWTMLASGELGAALASSLRTLALGFSLASVIGILLGLLIGRYRLFDAATDWLVNALYATPMIAIIPLVVLWFGLGDAAKLFIVSLITVFPVLINTAAGVRNVPAELIDVAASLGASEAQLFRKIIMPSAMPYMMTGLRLGIGRAIIAMVASEFFTALTGLGALIVKYGNQYDTASMFVPILLLMAMGILLTGLVRRAEERLAPWRSGQDD